MGAPPARPRNDKCVLFSYNNMCFKGESTAVQLYTRCMGLGAGSPQLATCERIAERRVSAAHTMCGRAATCKISEAES